MTKAEQLNRVAELARDMASYTHHSGYPVYDGGHSEPESDCQHPDCKAVREIQLFTIEEFSFGDENDPEAHT